MKNIKNEKILNFINNESILRNRKVDEKEKYILVKTLILPIQL